MGLAVLAILGLRRSRGWLGVLWLLASVLGLVVRCGEGVAKVGVVRLETRGEDSTAGSASTAVVVVVVTVATCPVPSHSRRCKQKALSTHVDEH